MDASLLLKRTLELFKLFLTGRIFKELNEVKHKMNASNQNSHKRLLMEKEQNLKISVVIPTLNESSYIEKTILAIKANHYRNFEVIIVDSMSDDETATKAQKLGARVIISKERNVGHQTHLGFISAKGDIIVRTDADTIFPQDTLTKTAHAFQNQQTAIYHVGHLYYDFNIFLNLIAHIYDKYWRRTWNTTGHFIAVRKSAYNKITFKPLAKGQDYDFGKRAYEILGSKAFVFDPDTTVLTSPRAIRKQRLFSYLLRPGSFKPREDNKQ
jgi:glycosyltransferase involved in cell wall biosynthesis